MFLATTANTDFWDSSQPLLMLGHWCLRQDRRADWIDRHYSVLPSLWDDREAFYRAAEYLDSCAEHLLRALTDFLNSVNGVENDIRYWRVLVGPWLLWALHVYYDRYRHLKAALEYDPNLTTIVLDPADYAAASLTPGLVGEAAIANDDLNLRLYSEILADLGFDFPSRGLRLPEASVASISSRGIRQRILNGVAAIAAAAPWPASKRILVHQMIGYVSILDVARVVLTSRCRIVPLQVEEASRANVLPRDARRTAILQFPAKDEFERLFLKHLADRLPDLVLERYAEASAEARRHRPAAVIASFGGWYSSERFRMLAAESHKRGAKLVSLQHGGGYGSFRFAPAERHERRLSDHFVVWGWADGAVHNNEVNASTPMLARFRRLQPRRGAADILFVANVQPRYFYRFHSMPVSSQSERYYEWQLQFIEALPEELRPILRFRGNPYADFGQAQEERLRSRFPWIRFDHARTFREAIESARVVVIDHNSTSVLQTLATDIPMVSFWDPATWELRPEAIPWFDRLRKARIHFDDPQSAAKRAAQLHQLGNEEDQSDVVQTRRQFADRFARCRKEWCAEWTRLFLGLTSSREQQNVAEAPTR